ncbi:methyltransferase domain-containing protein [Catellatospora bangladeshensis]|uniref:Delta(24)-sterol C-methyltransferase n=1 Tax=Catellatospora bangladeshensis TaxID=310355 RepID=A0A8J3JMI4_9ACTN|nr:methyltransferase domain-containing protein [Catellatospora bangladeshensis]GIF83317.1 delta(24)-sterol C-methyltransferase [Catellatospora bangladeshensis]
MNTQTLPGFVTAHLGQAVGAYYDRTADLYAQLWGDDIHLGYWDAGERPATAADRRPATERLIRELVGFAGIAPGSRVLDVGCGHGGPALYLAGRLGCEIDGITLSGEQVGRATARAAEEGLSGRTGFRVADVLGGGIAEGAYDVVWAMESLMHIPDRPAFFEVALRALRPGGVLALNTWAVREGPLDAAESDLVRRILHNQVLPSLDSIEAHRRMAEAAGFAQVRTADWTIQTAGSWDLDFAQLEQPAGGRAHMMQLARQRGAEVLRFFAAVPLMHKGFTTGVVTCGALTAVKPGAAR